MTRGVRIAIAAISCVLIAAHFYREDLYPFTIIALALPLLLLVGRPWATRLLQLMLVLTSVEWLLTLLLITFQRQAEGLPWVRTAIILGAVALLALWSAFAVREKKDNTAGQEAM